MDLMSNLRDRLAKRAAYNKTRRELAMIPEQIAVEDLGFHPSDAAKIAAQKVYG